MESPLPGGKPRRGPLGLYSLLDNSQSIEDGDNISIFRGFPQNVVDPPVEDTKTTPKGLIPDKPEITNYKHHLILILGQINSKLQYPNLK